MDRRFGSDRWEPQEAEALSSYIYHISAMPASGEYSLKSILMPLIRLKGPVVPPTSPHDQTSPQQQAQPQTIIRPFARVPLSPALLSTGALRKSSEDDSTPSVPVLILYGDSDWIAFPEMHKYTRRLGQLGVDARLVIIPQAGHHLYMDNPDGVHNSIAEWWAPYCTRADVER